MKKIFLVLGLPFVFGFFGFRWKAMQATKVSTEEWEREEREHQRWNALTEAERQEERAAQIKTLREMQVELHELRLHRS